MLLTIATPALISNPVLIFFIVLVIILLAPMLLNRLKIPHIVGLIVAGVAVGPFGFNLLERDSSFELFGQVGLLYLMFLAGLEIDMFHLKLNLRRGLIFGLFTFFIPLIIGAVASVVLLHLNLITSVLLATMYASHTLISYPVVARLGITKSESVLIAIVGTIVAVIGSLFVLAISVNFFMSEISGLLSSAILLAKIAAFAAFVLYCFPKITRWFFRTYNDNVMQFVYVMAMVFLASYLAQLIGLEAVLGAFTAGLVLNKYIPNVSPLMSRIEFVGNALFIPYFLIGVGMMTNIGVIMQSSTLTIAITMLVVAILSKWLAAWLTQRLFRLSTADRDVMFGLTTAHTAVALAVVTIGYNIVLPSGARLLNESILNGTIVMILVTCVLAPIITSSAATKVKLKMLTDNLAQETVPRRRAMNTLIPVSNPVTATSLMDLALMMKRRTTHDSIFALHVRNDNTASSRAIGENSLKLAGETAAAVNVNMQAIERYDINTVTGIVNTAIERNINDVVVGMHLRSNSFDSFYGIKIEGLLKELNKMVIISRCYVPLNTISRIVVAVPEKAEFETGFETWVIRVATLANRINARLVFHAPKITQPLIRGVIHKENIDVYQEYKPFVEWNDFALFANKLLDDDLLVVISARHTSLSFVAAMDEVPGLLSKYFGHNNLIIIYPEQFGEAPQLVSFSDPLTHSINSSTSLISLKARAWWRRISRRINGTYAP